MPMVNVQGPQDAESNSRRKQEIVSKLASSVEELADMEKAVARQANCSLQAITYLATVGHELVEISHEEAIRLLSGEVIDAHTLLQLRA